MTLSDCDTFIPVSQLKHLALRDEYPDARISDRESLDESLSDQASPEPWDEWQSWDDTDTYEDPGIPSIEMIRWENSERERRIREMMETPFEDESVVPFQASNTDVSLSHPSPSQTGYVSDDSPDEDDKNDAPKRRGPKRNATFPNPPHGALPHPILGMELDKLQCRNI